MATLALSTSTCAPCSGARSAEPSGAEPELVDEPWKLAGSGWSSTWMMDEPEQSARDEKVQQTAVAAQRQRRGCNTPLRTLCAAAASGTAAQTAPAPRGGTHALIVSPLIHRMWPAPACATGPGGALPPVLPVRCGVARAAPPPSRDQPRRCPDPGRNLYSERR